MIMAEKKITKREMWNQILEKYPLTDEEKGYINHEIELLDKRNSKDRKPTATQQANEGIKEDIVAYLENVDKPQSITDIIKHAEGCEDLSNQRVSALVRQLKEAGKVVRTEVKGRAYFSLA